MKKLIARFADAALTGMARMQKSRKCYVICFAPEVPEELK